LGAGATGKISFIQCFHRDITDRKPAEQTLREEHQKLEFALQAGDVGLVSATLKYDKGLCALYCKIRAVKRRIT
jgi:hypothetical protein